MNVPMGTKIHPTAIIDPSAEIAEDVEIGPYVVIGAQVSIEEGTHVGPHVVIQGPTRIGRDNVFIGQASIGTIPQDLKYQGESSCLSIGHRNRIREFVTINRGTEGGINKTVIGSDNLLMSTVHVAHDCVIGDGTVFAQSTALGGHVNVGDHAILGGFVGVHQFCRVGTYSFVGGYSVLTRDALPFVKTVGIRNRARIYGINHIGLERKGFSTDDIHGLKKAYRILFGKGQLLEKALVEVEKECKGMSYVGELVSFVKGAERGFVRSTGN